MTQENRREDKTREEKRREENRTEENRRKIRQDKTRQKKTRQDKTTQDKTTRHNTRQPTAQTSLTKRKSFKRALKRYADTPPRVPKIIEHAQPNHQPTPLFPYCPHKSLRVHSET